MNLPLEQLRVREATDDDARTIRAMLTGELLVAGYGAPSEHRYGDLVDLAYYRIPGRYLWVALDSEERVAGCGALEPRSPAVARLHRMAGRGLRNIVSAAVKFAQDSGYAAIEAFPPVGMDYDDAERLFASRGFAPPYMEGGSRPFRRILRRPE